MKRRSQKEWKMLFRNASHDLREPLRTVSTYLNLLQVEKHQLLDLEGRQFLGFAEQAAKRLRRQIESLLVLLELDLLDLALSPVPLSDALRSAIESTPGLEEHLQRELLCQVPSLPQASGDSGLLTQMFVTLLENAIKFTEPQGRVACIQIRAERSNGSIEIVVASLSADKVPDDKLEEIFHPFRRLHGRDRYPGEGLGLTLCRRIAQLHEGWAWASKVGPWIEFKVRLPTFQS